MRRRDRLSGFLCASARTRDHFADWFGRKLSRQRIGLSAAFGVQRHVNFAAGEHTVDQIVSGMTNEIKRSHARNAPGLLVRIIVDYVAGCGESALAADAGMEMVKSLP